MEDHSTDYYNAIVKVMVTNPKKTLEIAEVKTSIIDGIIGHQEDPSKVKVLSLGCNLVTMGLAQRKFDVTTVFNTDICEEVYGPGMVFEGLNIKINKGPDSLVEQIAQGNTYDVVLGLDQLMTYCSSEDEQKALIGHIAKVTKGTFITSLVDFKNQTSQSRMSDLPLTINIEGKQNLFVNHRTWNVQDKQSYINNWLWIEEDELKGTSQTKRRTMFFKQLAKFTTDSGATGFTVHKNVFYKPLINKTFEHVISIKYV